MFLVFSNFFAFESIFFKYFYLKKFFLEFYFNLINFFNKEIKNQKKKHIK